MISVVSQEPILFDCSIRDNIVYGLDSIPSMNEVIAAARSSNIHEFISSLPQVWTSGNFIFTLFDKLKCV